LIALLLALAGLTGRTSGLKLSSDAQNWLRWALILLIAAAIVGILANLPGRGRSVGARLKEIKKLMQAPTAENTEQVQFKGLQRAAQGNRWKGLLVFVALLIQAFGIGALAFTVWYALK
jgi:Sec-independent protein translocase protein TatA